MKSKFLNSQPIIVLFILFFTCTGSLGYGGEIEEKLTDKVGKLESKGAISSFGLSVGLDLRIGKTMAETYARGNITHVKNKLLTNVFQELCLILTLEECSELEEYFAPAGILIGVRTEEFGSLQTKENRKRKEFTYYVIVIMSPKVIIDDIKARLLKAESEHKSLKNRNLLELYNNTASNQKLETMLSKYHNNFKS